MADRTQTFYITKYALSGGVRRAEAFLSRVDDTYVGIGSYALFRIGREAFTDRDAANSRHVSAATHRSNSSST